MKPWTLLYAVVSRFGDRQGVMRPLTQTPLWPRHIHMTYRDLGRVPSYVHAALKRFAPNYTVTWYDDAACLAFMRAHASPRALQAYRHIPHGAHRADLWRYHVLQAFGGVYLDADLVLKATKVDGVYNADPMKDPDAERFESLTYDQVLDLKLEVMDLTAICLIRDHNMPLRVFNMNKPGALLNAVVGSAEGTLIEG